MEIDEKLIKLGSTLGIKINEFLAKKIQFTPRKGNFDLLSFEFTEDELALVDKLVIENPVQGSLEGVELLPNLKTLTIKSNNYSHYIQDRDILSISDRDGKSISKCKNLENLEIDNQAKLSYLDVSGLHNLHSLSINHNSNLEVIDGLDSLTELWGFDCVGNESLTRIEELNKAIINNNQLSDLNLDLLLFPDAVNYNASTGEISHETLVRFEEMNNVSWQEVMGGNKNIKINTYQMMKMHKLACDALDEYVPQSCGRKMAVVGIELYLAENVKYDDDSLDHSHNHSDNNLVNGPLRGANGAYNAFVFNSCVCEGYTRAMQYLLRLREIKSRNVHCISGKDTVGMSTNRDDRYTIYYSPSGGFHSIICIEDENCLYDDPCWNAGLYQKGNKSLPWTLCTKEEISQDHTLSFAERNINNNTLKVPRSSIQDAISRINTYRNNRELGE